MTEIKKTLAILKARWPEVTLIMGLYALAVLSNNLFQAIRGDLARTFILLYMLFSLTVMVVLTILNFGFMRTVYLQGQERQKPIVLLRKGRDFFSRIFGFGLIYLIPYFILAWLIFILIKYFTSTDTGFFETGKVNPWLYQLFFAAPHVNFDKSYIIHPCTDTCLGLSTL